MVWMTRSLSLSLGEGLHRVMPRGRTRFRKESEECGGDVKVSLRLDLGIIGAEAEALTALLWGVDGLLQAMAGRNGSVQSLSVRRGRNPSTGESSRPPHDSEPS